MSSSPPSFYKPREIASASESDEIQIPSDFSWESIEVFLKNRSLRRVFYLAGGASAFVAAWYIYQKLSEKTQLGSDVSTTSISGDGVRLSIEESSNNNTDLPSEKTTEQPVEDKVIIHCCPRGYFVPSIATEPLKLETFLRVANIPYEVSFCNEYETPFLTYGDKTGNDFRECIRILSEKFDVSLDNKDVTASRKTASHLVDISLENHFAWAILIWRWIFDEGKSMKKIHAMNALGEEVVPEVSQRIKDATRYHPIGQLDRAEFMKTINQDIHDMSAALSQHKYFQGQTPGAVDCHAFAILAQIMWNMPGSPFEHQLKKYANLVKYLKRIKEKYWPDWNELILKPTEFEENWIATYRYYRRSPSASKTKRNFRPRSAHGESGAEYKSGTEAHSGSDEEAGQNKTGDKIGDKTGDKTEVKTEVKTGDKTEVKTGDRTGNKTGDKTGERTGDKTGDKAGDKTRTTYSVSPAENTLPDPQRVTVITEKKDLPDESESFQENVEKEESQTASPPQPVGILEPGADVTTTDVDIAKLRSGFVSASVGSTKFPVENVNENSAPTLAKNASPDSPVVSPLSPLAPTPEQRQKQQQLRQDSIMHVHRPSVKFANVPSVESTISNQQVQQQQPQQPAQRPQQQQQTGASNEHFQASTRSPTSQIPVKVAPGGGYYPASAAELSSKRSREQQRQPEHNIHRSMMHQEQQYATYPQQQAPLLQTGAGVDGYQQIHNGGDRSQYFQPAPPQSGYGQASYSVPPHVSSLPRGTLPPPSYGQHLNYAPQQPVVTHPMDNESIGSFGPEHALNPEQMQKAAEAHLLNAYYQQQRQQQYHQQQQPQYNNNNYHATAGIVPSFVNPPFDPRNPAAALLRY